MMGFGGISIWQLLIILAIVVLLFGTKKLRGIGADLGGAVQGFKKGLDSDKKDDGVETIATITAEKTEQYQESKVS